MKTWWTGLSCAAFTSLVIGLASPIWAQEQPQEFTRPSGVLTFGQELEYDFDEGLQTRTLFGLTLFRATRTQTLSFSVGTEYRGDFRDDRDDDLFFDNSRAELRYSIRSATTSLSFAARLRDLDLEEDPFELEPGVLLINELGTVTTADIAARLETGIERPFGITLDASYRDSSFSGAVDADLSDETILNVDALARFNLTRSLSLRALAGLRQTDEDDLTQTETETTFFGFGLGTVSRGGLSFSGDILFDDSEITTNTDARESNDGLGFVITVNQPRPNGLVGAEIISRIDEAGRRTSAELIRELTLPTGGLALSLGVVDQEGVDDLQFIGEIAYRREMSRGAVSVSLAQGATTNDEDTLVSTNVRINYQAPINSVSSWQAGLGFLQTDELLTNETDSETTASFSYQRDLASDWSMETGIELSRDDDGDEENTFFFNIQRDITFGF